MAADAARYEMHDNEMMESDADLVAAALEDPSAFAPLYRRHVDAIYRFCLRRLGTREDAEDATSHVFAKALASLGGFRGGSFRAWLFAIADRHTLDRMRIRRTNAPLNDAENVPDTGLSPEAAVLASDARVRLRQRLDCLTEDQRRVVELRLSGLTGDEIAATTGRSRNAVDALQFRAIARLRRFTSHEVQGDANG